LVRLSRGTLAPSIHPAGEAVPFRRIVYWRAEMMEHHHPGKWDQYKQNNDHGEQDKPAASGCPIRSHNHVNPPLHQSNKQRGQREVGVIWSKKRTPPIGGSGARLPLRLPHG